MAATFEYLLDHQISRQWRGFLHALADEFSAQIDSAELRQLMYRVGARFAQRRALPACDSTGKLTEALNALWREADWGFVELADERDHLSIVHYCAPLPAFGERALAWTPAFLEGAYQHWLGELGAQGLLVRQASTYGDDASIEFRLTRSAS